MHKLSSTIIAAFCFILLLPASVQGASIFSNVQISEEELNLVRAISTSLPLLSNPGEFDPPLPVAGEEAYWRGRTAKSRIDMESRLKEAVSLGHWQAEILLFRVQLQAGSAALMVGQGEQMQKRLEALKKQKCAEAWLLMAEFYEKGLADTQRDYNKALSHYRRAAELGSTNAMVYLADRLYLLRDDKFRPVAERYYSKAFEHSSGSAAFGLGRLYLEQGRLLEAMPVLISGARWGNASCLKILANLASMDSAFFEPDDALSLCYNALSTAARLDSNDLLIDRTITYPNLEKRCPQKLRTLPR